MSYSGDAAEQVVRMSLETGEVAVRLAGSGAKQLAILLYAILREQKKTAGKARLTNMLRSGKELKVFAVKDSDLPLFCREAKKYGILYCVLKDRDATDGLTDIMARAEDASNVTNRYTFSVTIDIKRCSKRRNRHIAWLGPLSLRCNSGACRYCHDQAQCRQKQPAPSSYILLHQFFLLQSVYGACLPLIIRDADRRKMQPENFIGH